jgi:hypothetical protein
MLPRVGLVPNESAGLQLYESVGGATLSKK